jgi:hypothetical protein
MNGPVFELLRLVHIFSATWEKQSIQMQKLNDAYENKKHLLNIAIKRLAISDKRTKIFAREKRLSNWEKLFLKLSESKGHGRRWKLYMDTFRKKSILGYDQLIHWIEKEPNNYNDYDDIKMTSDDSDINFDFISHKSQSRSGRFSARSSDHNDEVN